MQNKKPEPWQQSLKMISNCPVCGHSYSLKKAKLFINKESAQLVHVTCGKCKGYFMAMVVVLGKGISTVGMVTDLSYKDMKRLHEIRPIEIDEVIEGYELMEGINLSSLIIK